MSRAVDSHKVLAPSSLGVYIVTCSTSRFNQLEAGQKPEDASGDIIERLVSEAGHRVEGRKLISDSKTMLRKIAKQVLGMAAVDALLISGGTGLSPRDVTIESIRTLIDKEIPGFGELFRKVSYDRIGPSAMLSRAFAGSARRKAIFCLPGSPDAASTAVEKLILPELGHMIKIIRER